MLFYALLFDKSDKGAEIINTHNCELVHGIEDMEDSNECKFEF